MKKKIFDEIPRIENDKYLIRQLLPRDAEMLDKLRNDDEVYTYLPTFLYEREDMDADELIEGMYAELFPEMESVFLGVFMKPDFQFVGIVEFYGYRGDVKKISVGCRFLKEYWGKGIATDVLGLVIKYLNRETETEIITASTMTENKASARVLEKNGFIRTTTDEEDWGFSVPTKADKWFL